MGNGDIPLKLILTRWYNSIREWILADVQQLIGNAIVGGKVIGGQVSGTIPVSSVPAHASTHKSGGSDTITPFGGEFSVTDLVVTGLTGATAASRHVGATASGSPGSGTFAVGDYVIAQNGNVYVCTVAGSPGTWVAPGGSGGGNTITQGAYGSEPASPSSGDAYLPTDAPVVEDYSGSVWNTWGPAFPFTKPPAVASWTWVNQGTATGSNAEGGLLLKPVSSDGADTNLRMLMVATPATPYTITAAFLYLPIAASGTFSGGVGLAWRDSVGGKIQAAHVGYFSSSGPRYFPIRQYTAPTTYASDLNSTPIPGNFTNFLPYNLYWMRLGDDGTNRTFQYSADGQQWFTGETEVRTNYMTPDQVGIFVNGNPQAMVLLHWKQA